jgi:hypothetical protein
MGQSIRDLGMHDARDRGYQFRSKDRYESG